MSALPAGAARNAVDCALWDLELQLAGSDSDFLGKSAIMGALQLYLDFLNLFMFLLQFMGNRE